MTFKLKPSCYAAYKKAHDELWTEIVAPMRDEGISMIIYHYEGLLFLHAAAVKVAKGRSVWTRARLARPKRKTHPDC